MTNTEKELRQLFKNRADAYLNTIDESVEQGMSEDCFIKAVNEVFNKVYKDAKDLVEKSTLTDVVKSFKEEQRKPSPDIEKWMIEHGYKICD